MGRKVLGKVVATVNGVNALNITSSDDSITMQQDGVVLDMKLDKTKVINMTQGHVPVNPESTEGLNMWVELNE